MSASRGRLPGRWQREWCRVCKTYRCGDPVYGPGPTRTELRRGWRRDVAEETA